MALLPETEKTVFLDVKNVLLRFDVKKMQKQIADFCGVRQETIQDTLSKTGWGEKYEKGEIDSRTLFHYLPENIRGQKGFPAWVEAVSNVFQPNDPIDMLVKELKKNGIRLFILSNICEMHFSYAYTRFSSFHLLDGYVLSYKTGMKKPDKKLYEYAMETTSSKREHSFFVEGIEEFAQQARLQDLDSESYINIDLLRSQLKKRKFLS